MNRHGLALACIAILVGCGTADNRPSDDDTAPSQHVAIAADETEQVARQIPDGLRSVRCEIGSDEGEGYSGPCLFTPDEGGSFALSLPGDEPIVSYVVQISVWLTGKGVAEVRGLTVDGINSRWGEAVRSSDDPACWTGSDFEICAR